MNRLLHAFLVSFCLMITPAMAAVTSSNVGVEKVQTSDGIRLSINLGNISRLDQVDENKISTLIEDTFKDLPAELQCSVEVNGEVTVGVAKISIKVTVSGPCSEIKKSGAQIANMILEQIKDALD